MYKRKGLVIFFLIVSILCVQVGAILLIVDPWTVGMLILINGLVGLFLCCRSLGSIDLYNKMIWEMKEEAIIRKIYEEEQERKKIREEELQKIIEELFERPENEPSFSPEEQEGKSSVIQVPLVSKREGFIICPTCQKEQRENRKVCFECGTVLNRDE